MRSQLTHGGEQHVVEEQRDRDDDQDKLARATIRQQVLLPCLVRLLPFGCHGAALVGEGRGFIISLESAPIDRKRGRMSSRRAKGRRSERREEVDDDDDGLQMNAAFRAPHEWATLSTRKQLRRRRRRPSLAIIEEGNISDASRRRRSSVISMSKIFTAARRELDLPHKRGRKIDFLSFHSKKMGFYQL